MRKHRRDAIDRGLDMAMIDEKNDVAIVTKLTDDEFCTFLLAGDKAPRL